MNIRFVITLCLSGIMAMQPLIAVAFETDQYNLPPAPLGDIGDEVSEYVEKHLRIAIDNVNSEINRSKACISALEKPAGCGSSAAEQKKLKVLLNDDAVALEVYNQLGKGNLFTTKFGDWMRSHKFRAQPDRYKTEFGETIFTLNPTDYLTLSATVRLFEAEFGIDKLEHFFQQGYDYYKIDKAPAARDSGKKAIEWGQRTERTYFGLLASGVYSNADLYANYAGMRFYQGLFKSQKIDGRSRPATLRLDSFEWKVDDKNLRENLLKPFMTDHLNEALNPSAFRLTLVRSIRRAVKKFACPDWQKAYPEMTRQSIDGRTRSLEKWNGENYGFTNKSRIVSIGDTCFAQ